ncbi:alpha-ribazole phosphatase [Enterococcus sp. AZ194]|uniref:histidine phosphatase family protein n=1 Tax=Enterococcus sp. AZ194 TaxID=2774629 RepID=UPI003F2439C7
MRISFIRHGQTDYNKKKLFYGLTDISINETGRKQAHQAANKVVAFPVKQVFSSKMKRTIETAKILYPTHRIQEKDYLNEWGFGLWEGLNADQIQERFPIEWQAWLDAPFDYTPPGAKPFKLFEEAMLNGFQELICLKQDIAIVTHLGTIRVLLHGIFPEIDFWAIDLDQGNVTVIDCQKEGFQKVKWNE